MEINIPSRLPPPASRPSYVERELGDVDDVLQVEDPAQIHLDGKSQHDEGEIDADHVPGDAHLLEEAPQERLRQDERQRADVEAHDGQSEDLPPEPEVGQSSLQDLDPDDLGEVDVVQRHELVDVPELVGPEEVPVGAAQERAQGDEGAPEHDESHQEDRDLPVPLLEREIAVTLRVRVDVRDRHQTHDDERGKDDAGQPRVVVDEHLLQSQ